MHKAGARTETAKAVGTARLKRAAKKDAAVGAENDLNVRNGRTAIKPEAIENRKGNSNKATEIRNSSRHAATANRGVSRTRATEIRSSNRHAVIANHDASRTRATKIRDANRRAVIERKEAGNRAFHVKTFVIHRYGRASRRNNSDRNVAKTVMTTVATRKATDDIGIPMTMTMIEMIVVRIGTIETNGPAGTERIRVHRRGPIEITNARPITEPFAISEKRRRPIKNSSVIM